LVASRQALTILHLIGLLLIVAVGSNYALFFERRFAPAAAGETPYHAGIAVDREPRYGPGLRRAGVSTVPVLSALGMTVAPGAFAALLFSALMARPEASRSVPS